MSPILQLVHGMTKINKKWPCSIYNFLKIVYRHCVMSLYTFEEESLELLAVFFLARPLLSEETFFGLFAAPLLAPSFITTFFGCLPSLLTVSMVSMLT